MKKSRGRKLNRFPGYDYSSNGYYFVTICTKDRKKCFGEINDDKMVLNRYGEIVSNYIEVIPLYYNNIDVDLYVVMPNHIHIIVIIESIDRTHVGTGHCPVPTARYGLLSKVIKSLKEIITKSIRKDFGDFDFSWQRSFYDHVIRNEKSLNQIREYIINNPQKWAIDKENIG